MIDVDAKEEQKPAGLFSVYPSYHGQDGNSDNTIIPKLVWQYQNYLAKQLYKFKREKKEIEIIL
jgi:cytochrome c553